MRRPILFSLLLLAASGAPFAGVRDDVRFLEDRVAELTISLEKLSARQEGLESTLQDLTIRLEALERASRTADIRADLDVLKRDMESLRSRLNETEARPVPTTLPALPSSASPETTAAPSPEGGEVPEDSAAADLPVMSVQTPDDLYLRGHEHLSLKRFELALTEFRQFLDLAPGHENAPNARYWIGECHYAMGRFEKALEVFDALSRNDPLGPKAAAARVKIGLCRFALGNEEQGREALREVIASYPGSEEAEVAQERLARHSAQ